MGVGVDRSWVTGDGYIYITNTFVVYIKSG